MPLRKDESLLIVLVFFFLIIGMATSEIICINSGAFSKSEDCNVTIQRNEGNIQVPLNASTLPKIYAANGELIVLSLRCAISSTRSSGKKLLSELLINENKAPNDTLNFRWACGYKIYVGFALLFTTITPDSSGNYTLVVRNISRKILFNGSVSINVLRQPLQYYHKVMHEHSIEITCPVKLSSVRWNITRNNITRRIKGQLGATMRIQSAIQTDSAVYTCYTFDSKEQEFVYGKFDVEVEGDFMSPPTVVKKESHNATTVPSIEYSAKATSDSSNDSSEYLTDHSSDQATLKTSSTTAEINSKEKSFSVLGLGIGLSSGLLLLIIFLLGCLIRYSKKSGQVVLQEVKKHHEDIKSTIRNGNDDIMDSLEMQRALNR